MKLLAVLSLIVVLGIPFLVSAQGQTALSDTGFENICSKRLTDSTESQFALGKCVANLYKLSLGLGAIVALFMIVISGYKYMNAAGNAQQVEGAKDSFSHAFIGLIIILVAYALLYTINPDLVKFRAVGELGKLPEIVITPPVVSAAATDLAKQIQANSKISLATSHVSGINDNATAKQNIADIASGQAAARSNYTHGGNKGPGGTVGLDPAMLTAMLELAKGFSFSVSEIAGGVHSANSAHYDGRAFDVNVVNGAQVNASNSSLSSFKQACRVIGAIQVLGPGDAGHSTHIHCAWQGGGLDVEEKALLSFIKPWSGQDPYPALVWDNTKPELKPAFDAFNAAWQAQGGSALQARQAFRPAEYQDHIRSVWEAWRLRNGQSSTVGYKCNETTHLQASDVQNLTAEQVSLLNGEVTKHSTATETTPPACKSDHSLGIAIDITPPATSGAVYEKWIQIGNSAGLCHNIAGDEPHFGLKKYLPAGTNCSVL